MLQVFERLDIFGKPVLFNFGKNSKSKSKVGAMFTLGFLGFVIWVVYYFGKEIIQKKNPSVTTSQSYQENPGEIQFGTNNTFVFNFGIQNKQTVKPFMNSSIFTFQASLYYQKTTPQDDGSSVVESESIPLDLEPCTKAYFGELGESFSYYELSSMYCLSKEQPNLQKHLSILGKPESPTFQTLQIAGYLCDSSTSTIPCGSKQEMDDALGFFQLQFSNTAVNPVNYEKPVTRFRDSYFTSTATDFTKEVDLWISPLEMTTDDGWLTESDTTESYVQFNKVSEFISQKGDSDPFFYFFLQADGVTKQYTRSYIKVQDIAARVNGIISFALVLLIILVTPYVRLKFYEELIHDLFDVKILQDQAGVKRSKTKKPSLLKQNEKSPEVAQQLTKQKTQAMKNRLLTIEEEIPHKKQQQQQQVQLKIMEEKKEEDTFAFSDNLMSSPRGESETKVQQQQNSLLKIRQPKEEGMKKKEYLSVEEQSLPISSLESPRGKSALKRSTYGSPTLLEMKPDLTKPTFKTLIGDNNDTRDAFEDLLMEMAINQQEEENNKQIIPSTERASMLKVAEEGGQTEREAIPQDRPDNPPQKEDVDLRVQIRKSSSIFIKNTEKIDLTFWEYLRSFFSQNEAIKEKMYILNEGTRRINERLDIFNLLKKLRELDKLKILLLEDDQYILFEGLPKPEIVRENNGSRTLKHNIKNAKFIQEKVKKDLILASYQNVKLKKEGNIIDKKLLRIFDDIMIE